MKTLILGAGAMGCLYGAKLKEAGYEVTLIDINVPHMDAINARGLQIKIGEEEHLVPIAACKAEDFYEPADFLIVFTKNIYSRSALESVRHLITEQTNLVSFQNGLGNETLMREYADEAHIIVGTTSFPSDLVGNGSIVSDGTGITKMMTVDGTVTPALLTLESMLGRAGLNPQVTQQVFAAIWEKAAFNAAVNALSAVTLLPIGYLGQTTEGTYLAHVVIDETVRVAEKKGINVSAGQVHALADRLFQEHFDHCPSMLQDVLQRRTTEIEFINGAIAREAEALGMEVPVTKTLYQIISIVQQTYQHRLTAS